MAFLPNVPPEMRGSAAGAVQRMENLLAEIETADRVGLDSFGVGEHHRAEFLDASPAIILAAAAARTKTIRLNSAVTVLSAADPVRVFQDFATIDLISNGRAEIVAERGSFAEAYPLFGFAREDYDALFAEKLGLLMQLNEHTHVPCRANFGINNAGADRSDIHRRRTKNELGHIKIVDHHVAKQPARHFDIGHRRRGWIKGCDAQQFRPADLARIQRVFQRVKAGIKAAVEPDHHGLTCFSDNLLARARTLKAEINRLFTQHSFASLCGLFHEVGMGVCRRCNQHCFNRGIRDDVISCARRTLEFSSQLFCIFRDVIRNSNQRATCMGRDCFGVNPANTACAEKTNFQHLVCFLRCPVAFGQMSVTMENSRDLVRLL